MAALPVTPGNGTSRDHDLLVDDARAHPHALVAADIPVATLGRATDQAGHLGVGNAAARSFPSRANRPERRPFHRRRRDCGPISAMVDPLSGADQGRRMAGRIGLAMPTICPVRRSVAGR
jgi:hypothetical protein